MKLRSITGESKRIARLFRDLEWSQRRKLASLWLRRMLGLRRDGLPRGAASSQRILVICHGNIMRSPYAAAVLRNLSAESGKGRAIEIVSAGMLQLPPRRADARARDNAVRRGFSLEGHVSQPLTEQVALSADLILVMDRLNETMLLTRFPELESKVVLLGFFGRGKDDVSIEIDDPYVHGPEFADGCFTRIDRATEHFWRELVKG